MTKILSVNEVSMQTLIALTRRGDEIILEENGKPIAKIMPIVRTNPKQHKDKILINEDFNVAFLGNRVRVYELAKKLRRDTKLIMEELRREGADISVPSNSVSKKLAEKIWKKYSQISNREQSQMESPSVPMITKPKELKDAVENDVANNLQNSTIIEKLPWKIFSEKEWRFNNLVKHFNYLSSKKIWKEKKFDELRLMKIEQNLNPILCYVGEREFEGYVVYCFDRTDKVILECPFYKNASYIISGDWKEITKSSKWMAKHKHSDRVKVIYHSKNWFDKLKRTLNNFS